MITKIINKNKRAESDYVDSSLENNQYPVLNTISITF